MKGSSRWQQTHTDHQARQALSSWASDARGVSDYLIKMGANSGQIPRARQLEDGRRRDELDARQPMGLRIAGRPNIASTVRIRENRVRCFGPFELTDTKVLAICQLVNCGERDIVRVRILQLRRNVELPPVFSSGVG